MSTKRLIVNILKVISAEPKTILEITQQTNASKAFIEWIVNGKRYGDLFTNQPVSPTLISCSPKGLQYIQDAQEQETIRY